MSDPARKAAHGERKSEQEAKGGTPCCCCLVQPSFLGLAERKAALRQKRVRKFQASIQKRQPPPLDVRAHCGLLACGFSRALVQNDEKARQEEWLRLKQKQEH